MADSDPNAGSFRQPWLNDAIDSSNPETLHEIPLAGLQSGIADRSPLPRSPDHHFSADSPLPRPSGESTAAASHMSPTSYRLAELRAEMRANRAQIEQLSEAHRAVQNAVSGINATQEMLHVAPPKSAEDPEKGAEQPAAPPRRPTYQRSMGGESKFGDFQAKQDLPEQPMNQPAGADRQGWVDNDYYDQNPWYGQAKQKPVFSLGRPLPHVNRTRKKAKVPKKQKSGDVEAGQGGSGGSLRKRKIGDDSQGQGSMHGRGEGSGDWLDVDFDNPKPPNRNESRRTQTHKEAQKGEGYEAGDKYKIDGEPLGQPEQDVVEEGLADPDELRNWWARFRARYPEPLAEFLATGMTTFLGLSATLSVNLSASQTTHYGTYETACWAWGFSLMFGIYIGGGVSGAHMNPATSICLSIFRGFPWRQCGVYIVIQFLASFVAALIAYGVYYDAIHYVDPDLTKTYSSFFAFPQVWVSIPTAVFSQFIGSAVVMIAIFALGDDQNNPPGAGMHAFILGMLTTTMKFCLGYNTGSALNPASDFGPRLVSLIAGYRTPEIFKNPWWIYGPWAAALAGAIGGCVVYDAFIFVGSESPVNYRVPKNFNKRLRQLSRFK